MNRTEAIGYLVKKKKLEKEGKFTKGEEKEIKKVMVEGKIYGDPLVEVGF